MHTTFSHGDVCPQEERLALEVRYEQLLQETDTFDRRLVSYQGNKGKLLHSWMRYKEGFSAQLVETLLHQFAIKPGNRILEPFAGSATTLLIAKSLGIEAIGIEILPLCHLIWEAKNQIFDYDLDELQQVYAWLQTTEPAESVRPFPHLVITEGAFASNTERDLMFYTEWFANLAVSNPTKTLLKLALTSSLEDISYTRKDGQYLRWDYRSPKMLQRNDVRVAQGKKAVQKLDKGILPSAKDVFLRSLGMILDDIRVLRTLPFRESQQELRVGSALQVLPTLDADQFHAVITSPPYCNRYDYTRTYALELAYLGVGEEGVRALRQSQLSCTVENRPKVDWLETLYTSLGQQERYKHIKNAIETHPAFVEVNHALQVRWERGEINNRGILSMVRGYFTELTFIFAEVLRTCRSGAQVAFVNDNVRYGGEIIPVDLLSTSLAEHLGFEPVSVMVLPQRKGNSSQQMGKFGREALRKSITIWRKP